DIADSWFTEEKIPEAAQGYRTVIARYGQTEFGPLAEFGLARCQEEAGHFGDALASYQRVLPRYPNPDVVKLRMERLEVRRASLKPTDAGNYAGPAVDAGEGD